MVVGRRIRAEEDMSGMETDMNVRPRVRPREQGDYCVAPRGLGIYLIDIASQGPVLHPS